MRLIFLIALSYPDKNFKFFIFFHFCCKHKYHHLNFWAPARNLVKFLHAVVQPLTKNGRVQPINIPRTTTSIRKFFAKKFLPLDFCHMFVSIKYHMQSLKTCCWLLETNFNQTNNSLHLSFQGWEALKHKFPQQKKSLFQKIFSWCEKNEIMVFAHYCASKLSFLSVDINI